VITAEIAGGVPAAPVASSGSPRGAPGVGCCRPPGRAPPAVAQAQMRRAQLQPKPATAFPPCRKASSKRLRGNGKPAAAGTSSPRSQSQLAGASTYIRTKAALAYRGRLDSICSVAGSSGWKLDSRIDNRFGDRGAHASPRSSPGRTRKLLMPYGPQCSQYRATDLPRSSGENTRSVCSNVAQGCLLDNAVVESFFSTLKIRSWIFDEPNRKDLTHPSTGKTDLAFLIDGLLHRSSRNSTISYSLRSITSKQFNHCPYTRICRTPERCPTKSGQTH